MKIKLLIITLLTLTAMSDNTPSHHTENGFRNPWPTYREHGFSDFLKWTWDRMRGNRPDRPDEYHFETAENDGAYLRQNRSDFTVTWVGHSTFLIQIDGVNILIDPTWSDRASPFEFTGPKRFTPPGIAQEDLPQIDLVIISHNHYDHLNIPTLQKIPGNPLHLVPLKTGKLLRKHGINIVVEMDWWDSYSFRGLEIVFLPAQHFSARSPFDRNKSLWGSFVIKSPQHSFCFIGDTGYFPGFKEIGDKYGPFDLVALPIGAFLPKWFMGPVHLDPSEAVQAFRELKANIFLPHHYGTFQLADDPLDLPMKLLREEIASGRLAEDKAWLLKPGETRIIR